MPSRAKFIEALRIAAKGLGNGQFNYSWTKPRACNCGIVAQAILGLSELDLGKAMHDDWFAAQKSLHLAPAKWPTWSQAANLYCPITGSPMETVFKTLYDAGFTREDFRSLEYMNDPKVLKRMGYTLNDNVKLTRWQRFKAIFKKPEVPFYQKGEMLIVYLFTWADMLEQQEREHPPTEDDALTPEMEETANRLMAKK